MATNVRTFRPGAKMPARTRVAALRRRGSQKQRATGIPGALAGALRPPLAAPTGRPSLACECGFTDYRLHKFTSR